MKDIIPEEIAVEETTDDESTNEEITEEFLEIMTEAPDDTPNEEYSGPPVKTTI